VVINARSAREGLEIIAQLRLSDPGHLIPFIVSTREKLQRKQLQELQRETLRVVAKGEDVGDAVLRELRVVHGSGADPSAASTPAQDLAIP